MRFGFLIIFATGDFFLRELVFLRDDERFAVDFFEAAFFAEPVFLAVDFLPVDFLPVDFLAVDLLPVDFFAVVRLAGFLCRHIFLQEWLHGTFPIGGKLKTRDGQKAIYSVTRMWLPQFGTCSAVRSEAKC